MLGLLLRVFALACFALATLIAAFPADETTPRLVRLNLVSLGLAFWVGSELAGT